MIASETESPDIQHEGYQSTTLSSCGKVAI